VRDLTLIEVAAQFGKRLGPVGKRSFCPLREHKRRDKTFGTFLGRDGTQMFKCWSCDPPYNSGDALKLYAMLSGMDRKEAWKHLRDQGYAVPGMKDEPGSRRSSSPPPKMRTPIQGQKPKPDGILPLDLSLWQKWYEQRLGAVERFAEQRKLDPNQLRKLDVVDVAADAVGFGYRDPDTGLPCRVKVRPIERKSFWIEPRAPEGVNAAAKSPLYMAHSIEYAMGGLGVIMVVLEGEVDALTLRSLGIKNVISLPDGAGSASRVDLSPVWIGSSLLLSAVDADDEGEKAHRELFDRTYSQMGKTIGRVYWDKDGKRYKDANEARLAGFDKGDFLGCLQRAADATMGFAVNMGNAAE